MWAVYSGRRYDPFSLPKDKKDRGEGRHTGPTMKVLLEGINNPEIGVPRDDCIQKQIFAN